MRIGLAIYGSVDMLSGGYLYDRTLVVSLRADGDEVSIISVPRRNYVRNLTDDFSSPLRSRLLALHDVLLQDELNHPSLFLLNRFVRERLGCLRVTILHLLRSSGNSCLWHNAFSRASNGGICPASTHSFTTAQRPAERRSI